MKRLLIYFLLLIIPIISYGQSNLNGIVLSEILPDPNSSSANFDTDGDGTAETSDEFFEIHNTTMATIDISGWEIYDGPSSTPSAGANYIFPGATGSMTTTIGPDEKLVLVNDYTITPPATNPPTGYIITGISFSNGGEQVILYNPTADQYIGLTYNNYNGGMVNNAEVLLDHPTATTAGDENWGNDTDGESLQRDENNSTNIFSGTPTPLTCASDNTPVCSGINVGDLVITEMLIDEAPGQNEWFEIYNNTGSSIDLTGLAIEDNDSNSEVINTGSAVTIAANSYAVISVGGTTGCGASTSIYNVTTFGFDGLDNSGDIIRLVCDATVVDEVDFTSGFLIAEGIALNFDDDLLDGTNDNTENDVAANWCDATTLCNPGEFGTPGTMNISCSTATCSITAAQEEVGGCNVGMSTYDVTIDPVAVNGSASGYTYTVNGGAPVSASYGSVESVGSFAFNATVDIVITDADDANCTFTVPTITIPAGCITGDLVITGVYDGSLAGGTPKGIELYVINDIPDLSIYGLGSANNGGGSDGVEFTFPADMVTAGSCIYVSSEAVNFNSFFGFAPDYTTNVMGINGDDAVELFLNGNVIDVFGDINVNGDGEPWDYTDGWAYRVSGTGPDGSTFVLANWTFSGIDVYDPVTTNAAAMPPMPICQYSVPMCSITAAQELVDNCDDIAGTYNVSINPTVMNGSASGYTYTVNGGAPVSANYGAIEAVGSFAFNATVDIVITDVDDANCTFTVPTITIPAMCDNCPMNLTDTELGDPITAGTYEASNDITSTGTVNVGSLVVLDAGNSVILTPGFEALEGSDFTGMIGGCIQPLNSESTNANLVSVSEENQRFSAQTNEETLSISTSAEVGIFPNPSNYTTTFSIELEQESKVEISIYDINGRLLQNVKPAQILSYGTHQFETNVEHLQGIYFVKFLVGDVIITKRLLVIR